MERTLLSPRSGPGRSGTTSLTSFFFSSRRRHTRFDCDWSSDVCSSDLPLPLNTGHEHVGTVAKLGPGVTTDSSGQPLKVGDRVAYRFFFPCGRCRACRSEEHTSELQSQSNLVCRLLLEKKKQLEDKVRDLDVVLDFYSGDRDLDLCDVYDNGASGAFRVCSRLQSGHGQLLDALYDVFDV